MPRAWARRLLAAGLLVLGLWQLGLGLWIPAKAAAAQLLLRAAWVRTTAGAEAPPWPWADFLPLAELRVAGERYIVATDAGGEGLAFAPSHVAGSDLPGMGGTMVIAAHRDTHFAGLDTVTPGQEIRLTDRSGRDFVYTVTAAEVLDSPHLALPGDGVERLVLVTCWPLRSAAINPSHRLAIVAEAITGGTASASVGFSPTGE